MRRGELRRVPEPPVGFVEHVFEHGQRAVYRRFVRLARLYFGVQFAPPSILSPDSMSLPLSVSHRPVRLW